MSSLPLSCLWQFEVPVSHVQHVCSVLAKLIDIKVPFNTAYAKLTKY